MINTKKRKLRAILFADIVGYTSLMQKNEANASALLQKFRNKLNDKVSQHSGEVINNYGDGCLCTFESAMDAMTCAKEVQMVFQQEPIVPVRIGLHSGDVFFEDANVFGDSVNIASRIESLSVAGAVLFSKPIKRHISNQTTFEVKSLGEFDFKNVEKKMEIFVLVNEGLVVPMRAEMKGKLKETIKTKPKKYWYWLSLLIIPLLFGIYKLNDQTKKTVIEENILKERIAVLPFKNNTNDSDLDILGDMSADWINKGLMDIGEAEVVSPFTVRTHKAAIGILANDPTGRPSFSELTGAQNLITGNYYKQEETLIFKLEIVDAELGNLRFSFKDIKGNINEPEKLITQLREQVTGYWVARDMVDSKRIKAPNFKAYNLYISKQQDMASGTDLLEILALDSTFYLARLDFLNNNRSGVAGDNKIHFEFLERHISKLSVYEKGWFNFTKGLYLGKPELSFNSLNHIRKKYPKDPYLNHETAAAALDGLNNPELTLEIYNELPIEHIQPEALGRYYNFRIRNSIRALIAMNKSKEVNVLLNKAAPIETTVSYYYLHHFKLLAAIKNINEVMIAANYEEYITSYDSSPSFHIIYFFNIGFTLLESNLLPNKLRVQLKRDLLNRYNQLESNDINRLLWNNHFAWVEKKPKNISLEHLDQMPMAFQISNLYFTGWLHVESNQVEKIPFILSELQKYTTPNYSITSGYGCALAHYYIASLQTQIGQYDLAMDNLKKAKALGIYNLANAFQYDDHLAPLNDRLDFQELLLPIWPEIKG